MALGPAYGDGFAGVANFTNERTVYVKGSEFIDGSVRFHLDVATETIVRVEMRVSGIWVLSELEANITSGSVALWLVDDDLAEFVLDPTGAPVIQG